jgi:hypothetical protein
MVLSTGNVDSCGKVDPRLCLGCGKWRKKENKTEEKKKAEGR